MSGNRPGFLPRFGSFVPTIGKPVTRVTGAEEMLAAAQAKFHAADIIIFAAAVADFQPLEKSGQKFPKVGNNITIELKPTPDIAATLCANKRDDQVAVGFALLGVAHLLDGLGELLLGRRQLALHRALRLLDQLALALLEVVAGFTT